MKNAVFFFLIFLLPVVCFTQKNKKLTKNRFEKSFLNKEWTSVFDDSGNREVVLSTFNDSIIIKYVAYTASMESYYSQEINGYRKNDSSDTLRTFYSEPYTYLVTFKDDSFWIQLINSEHQEYEYLFGYFLDKKRVRIGFNITEIPADKNTADANWMIFE